MGIPFIRGIYVKNKCSVSISDFIGNSHYPAAALWEKIGNEYA